MIDRLQPSLENLDIQTVMLSAVIFVPDVDHWDSNPIVVPPHAGIPAETLLLVVDRWLDKPLDDTGLATKIHRDPVMTEWETVDDSNMFARHKDRGLPPRRNDPVVSRYIVYPLLFHRASPATLNSVCGMLEAVLEFSFQTNRDYCGDSARAAQDQRPGHQ
jgi:hypothetical protein